ncbi:MAG TPA: flagellar export protein FliJ [Candidatus Adamsella sp.]|nr:flagellar export protein FliJ [Candidatus Adamsella sp.]
MKKFKFRLENVLELRTKTLEDRQLEMAAIQARLNDANNKLDSLEQSRLQAKRDLENILGAGENIEFIRVKNYQDYIAKLDDDISIQHKVIADIENELELKQEEVREALKAKKMLEKLKEKEYKAFLKDFEQREAKELDDIALTRYRGSGV